MTIRDFLVTDESHAHELISAAHDGYTHRNTPDRVKFADDIIEGYWCVNKRLPGAVVLERLGSYILRNYYEDRRRNKRRLLEYNFHSPSQTDYDSRHEFPNEDIQIGYDGVIGYRSNVNVNVDGDSLHFRQPIRKFNVPITR